jgi:DNA repair protein RadC
MRFCSNPVDTVVVMPEPKPVTRSNRTLAQPSPRSGGTRHDSESTFESTYERIHEGTDKRTQGALEGSIRQDSVPCGPRPGARASEDLLYHGPRERIVAQGPNALTDAELLAVCLGSGTSSLPVLRLAQGLLAQLGGIAGVFSASPQALLAVPGLGPAKVAVVLGARALGERMARAELGACDTLSNSAAVLRYVQIALARYEQEVFACLFLDTRHRLLHFDKLFFGSVDRANVYPREILKRALTYNAAAVILAHNHPSGVAEPSSSDIRITATIKELMTHLDVRVLDHVVVAAGSGVSMAQRGLI